ncbi:hypothetical protein BC829DRAFT_424365 [Chytridium lagenaria]|nr:hypothetical protein BC829DRAFT_424365 [Chytridium lagenaria]
MPISVGSTSSQHNHPNAYNARTNKVESGSGDTIKSIESALASIVPASTEATSATVAYSPFEYTGSATATHILVVLGTAPRTLEQALTASSAHKDLGVVRVRVLRPWSASHLLSVVPTSATHLVVVDATTSSSASSTTGLGFGQLFLDVAGSFHSGLWTGADLPSLREARVRLSAGQTVTIEAAKAILDVIGASFVSAETGAAPSFTVDVRNLNVPSVSCDRHCWSSVSGDIPDADLETPYLSILNQLFRDRLDLANVLDAQSLLTPPDASGEGSAQDGTSAEYGLGLHLARIRERDQVISSIRSAVASPKVPPTLAASLNTWLQAESSEPKLTTPRLELKPLQPSSRLRAPKTMLLSRFYRLAYDIGTSGVHQVIASKANVNILILDTQPYSEKKSSKAADIRKKDIGLYAMTYGGVYVSSVALQANYSGVVRALQEADTFDGPSVVLAYAPRVVLNRGGVVKGGGGIAATAALAALKETKLAVDEGYWPLYVGTPKTRWKAKIRESYEALLASLNATPVLILYGGIEAKVAVMDDVPVEQLPKHKHVVFVFPGNSRETWKALQGLNAAEANLADVKFAVFAMGDSHYWPLPSDAHYFCKSGKDLDARLGALGAQRMLEAGLGDDRAPDGPMTAYKSWTPDLWSALGVAGVEVSDAAALAAGPTDDAIKEASNFLRGSIAAGLVDTSTGQLADLDTKITKFHGIYQQDDRDIRDARARAGLEKAFSFMIRVRVPGGVSTPEQWLAMDEIADRHANGTLKLTTRQTFQFHGVLKRNLKKTMQEINQSLMDTIAACGDVNRNVMCNTIPNHSPLHADVFEFTKRFSEHLLPKTNAYHEIWLDKKDIEPIYGKAYLPRKFKVAVAVPPYNDVDVFAHDLGYIAVEENGRLLGFNVTVGGGMGMTHGMKTTYPRLGDVIGSWEQVVCVQRDFGDRTNRKHARLKYTIDDRGIEWFVTELESRLGYKLAPARPYKYGWIQAQDGTWSYTLFVQNGRVKDTPKQRYKTGLREVAKTLEKLAKPFAVSSRARPEFRLSPNQNLVIANIPSGERLKVEEMLREHGIENGQLSGLRLNSMACVALPTCALAMAESERYLPDLQGLREDAISIRMTGCPNGCARPQIAEIAFVGKAPGSYNMYLGGGHNGERLNKIFKESVGEEEILASLKPIVKDYALSRVDGEHFGDFVIRKGYVKATLKGKDFHDI